MKPAKPKPEMTCQDLVEVLSDYLERQLTEAEAKWTEAHLAECDACRAYLDQLRKTVEGLRAIGGAEADAGQVERILAAMR